MKLQVMFDSPKNLSSSFDSLLKVWFDQHRKVKKMSHEMDGKIVLVTGATNGIGKVAALELAKKGAVVTIVGRNAGKTAATAAEISKVSGNPTVEFLLADLSVMAQVRHLAGEFRQKHDRLDVLVNNAGAYFAQRQLSADGYEMTFALNHLSYFLLTDLLVDLLKASAPARIVNVSSGAHNLGPLDFNDLMTEDYGMAGFKAYGRSKLANVMFTYELARMPTCRGWQRFTSASNARARCWSATTAFSSRRGNKRQPQGGGDFPLPFRDTLAPPGAPRAWCALPASGPSQGGRGGARG